MTTIQERLEHAKQVAGNGQGLYGFDILALVEEIERLTNVKREVVSDSLPVFKTKYKTE